MKQKILLNINNHMKFLIIVMNYFAKYLKEKNISSFDKLTKEERFLIIESFKEKRLEEINSSELEVEKTMLNVNKKNENIKEITQEENEVVEEKNVKEKKIKRDGLRIIKKKNKTIKEELLQNKKELNEYKESLSSNIEEFEKSRKNILLDFRKNIISKTMQSLNDKIEKKQTFIGKIEVEIEEKDIKNHYQILEDFIEILEKEIELKRIQIEYEKEKEEQEQEETKKTEYKNRQLKENILIENLEKKKELLKNQKENITKKETILIEELIGLGTIIRETSSIIRGISDNKIPESINMWNEMKLHNGLETISIFTLGWMSENILVNEYRQILKEKEEVKSISLEDWTYFSNLIGLYKTQIKNKISVLFSQINELDKTTLNQEEKNEKINKFEKEKEKLLIEQQKIIKKAFEIYMTSNTPKIELKEFLKENIKNQKNDICEEFLENQWKEGNQKKYNSNLSDIKYRLKKAYLKEEEKRSNQEKRIITTYEIARSIPTIDLAIINKETNEVVELLEAKSLTITKKGIKLPLFLDQKDKEKLLRKIEGINNQEEQVKEIRKYIINSEEDLFKIQKRKQDKISNNLNIEEEKVVFYMTIFNKEKMDREEYKIPFSEYIKMFNEREFLNSVSIELQKEEKIKSGKFQKKLNSKKERMYIDYNFFNKYFKKYKIDQKQKEIKIEKNIQIKGFD